MPIIRMPAKRLEVSHGRVVCPDNGELLPVDDCKECLFLRREQLTGATSEEGASGFVICELIKVEM